MSAPLQNTEVEAGHSLWQDAWLRLRKNKMAVGGAIFVLVLALASFSSLVIPGLSYSAQDLQLGAKPPSFAPMFSARIALADSDPKLIAEMLSTDDS